ncbi:MAG: hypothetical protein V2I33_07175 [Kangiellaceae bacterium]|jgi:hypothetical protein|nr:hypothetical protein [Kangiellaceae bacterium]
MKLIKSFIASALTLGLSSCALFGTSGSELQFLLPTNPEVALVKSIALDLTKAGNKEMQNLGVKLSNKGYTVRYPQQVRLLLNQAGINANTVNEKQLLEFLKSKNIDAYLKGRVAYSSSYRTTANVQLISTGSGDVISSIDNTQLGGINNRDFFRALLGR